MDEPLPWVDASARYGDLDDDISFRSEWLTKIERGVFKGAVQFAQDILGNFYAFAPQDGRVVYFSRSTPEYAVLAPDFNSFLKELERRNFKILEWTESIELSPCDWNA